MGLRGVVRWPRADRPGRVFASRDVHVVRFESERVGDTMSAGGSLVGRRLAFALRLPRARPGRAWLAKRVQARLALSMAAQANEPGTVVGLIFEYRELVMTPVPA